MYILYNLYRNCIFSTFFIVWNELLVVTHKHILLYLYHTLKYYEYYCCFPPYTLIQSNLLWDHFSHYISLLLKQCSNNIQGSWYPDKIFDLLSIMLNNLIIIYISVWKYKYIELNIPTKSIIEKIEPSKHTVTLVIWSSGIKWSNTLKNILCNFTNN